MIEAGWSTRRVARRLDHSNCVVRRCCDQWIREILFTWRPGSGSHRQTSRGEDRRINQVVFSDESRFNLRSDDNRACVWRPRGERLNPGFALQRHTTHTAGVMVWGAIAYNTQFPLVLIRGTMIAQRYVHDILQPHVLPLMQHQELFFNKIIFSLTEQGCDKSVSSLLLLFLGLPDPQICLKSSISGII
ncbi:transposable element Tcb2 transposase [Trichonephila clavipes]|nr:transposable element Tcb2 transposase [Trichonephila clavipes]